jgi:hypothetical protein
MEASLSASTDPSFEVVDLKCRIDPMRLEWFDGDDLDQNMAFWLEWFEGDSPARLFLRPKLELEWFEVDSPPRLFLRPKLDTLRNGPEDAADMSSLLLATVLLSSVRLFLRPKLDDLRRGRDAADMSSLLLAIVLLSSVRLFLRPKLDDLRRGRDAADVSSLLLTIVLISSSFPNASNFSRTCTKVGRSFPSLAQHS